jgi:hypothetical protein|tara:strand:+ start:122 stop:382 length:261 start_codon:yes stop_codon:yes gene_type:complete
MAKKTVADLTAAIGALSQAWNDEPDKELNERRAELVSLRWKVKIEKGLIPQHWIERYAAGMDRGKKLWKRRQAAEARREAEENGSG